LGLLVNGKKVSATCWDDLVPLAAEIEEGTHVLLRGEVRMFKGRGGWQYGLDAREIEVHDENFVQKTEQAPPRRRQRMARDGGTWPRRARKPAYDINDMAEERKVEEYINDIPFLDEE
jgi:hypothetical protein